MNDIALTAIPPELALAAADPDAALEKLLTDNDRLYTLNTLREYMIATQTDQIPPNLAKFGVMVARKIRGSRETTGRAAKRESKAAAAIAAPTSDAELDF